jgi:NlpC/P60 family putative phage cell wall peptidase
MLTPTRIVAIARQWLGTPYHHQASLKGAGCDCVGLVRGIWREIYGAEPEPLPAYTRDWAEAEGRETLMQAVRRHLVEVSPTKAQPGDVLIFRWRHNAPAKHCAVLATRITMIHALEGAPVSEVSLSPWWKRHLAGVFRFPEDGGIGCEPASPRSCLSLSTPGPSASCELTTMIPRATGRGDSSTPHTPRADAYSDVRRRRSRLISAIRSTSSGPR